MNEKLLKLSNNQLTEEQICKVAEILKLGKVKDYGTERLVKCPFCRERTHSFYINISSGRYFCECCGELGNLKDLGIVIAITFYEKKEDVHKTFYKPIPNEHGTGILFPFENKNFNDTIALAKITPSLIVRQDGNINNFCFIYYFSNLQLETRHYEMIFYRLYKDFKDVISDKVPTDDELLTRYTLECANNVYYKVIDYYTDEQLSALIDLFYEDSEIFIKEGKDSER